MSLAARCPACGTVFRVVQDQLRVSEGWVRCGRCTEVFNAIESLVDLDAVGGSPAPILSKTGSARVTEDLQRTREIRPQSVAEVDELGVPETPFALDEATTAEAPGTWPSSSDNFVTHTAEAALFESEMRADPPTLPAFVRQADRAARWKRPGVRWLLAALVLCSSGLLAGQAVYEYRDIAAVRWTSLAPMLNQVCHWLDCRVEAPRVIDSLVVDSSSLVRIEGTALYRLSVALRNRSSHGISTPALDLSITDSQGALIARRVIGPAEFGAVPDRVPALSELLLQATLGNAERSISGYTIELFYP